MKVKMSRNIKRLLRVSPRDVLLSLFILGITFGVCFFLKKGDNHAVSVPMIFILAVFLISRFTSGHVCGTVCSLISVPGVNYVFTYPNFEFNYTLAGYPVTAISMLVVSITTSALTTQIMQQEKVKIEAEVEKTRSNLLRSVSHDLRTPLTSILGASSAILENDDNMMPEDRKRLASEVKDDAQWLIQMVENLLSITRIGREARIIKRFESVEEVVAESLQKFRKRFPDFSVKANVPEEILMIPMDAILIEQIIINLLENAALHSKSDTATELAVSSKDNFVFFQVRDYGIGIEKEMLPHIFEGYFSHTTDGATDAKKNMGIGLSVCATIIRAHGGEMMADNAKGGGAVFQFTLPKEEDNGQSI